MIFKYIKQNLRGAKNTPAPRIDLIIEHLGALCKRLFLNIRAYVAHTSRIFARKKRGAQYNCLKKWRAAREGAASKDKSKEYVLFPPSAVVDFHLGELEDVAVVEALLVAQLVRVDPYVARGIYLVESADGGLTL